MPRGSHGSVGLGAAGVFLYYPVDLLSISNDGLVEVHMSIGTEWEVNTRWQLDRQLSEQRLEVRWLPESVDVE